MIPLQPLLEKHQDWKLSLAQAIDTPKALLSALEIDDPALLDAAEKAQSLFKLRVTHSYLARMEKGNPDDPLLRQILPLGAEFEKHAGYSSDPVGDLPAQQSTGLLHKYKNRVLLVTTGVCAINCRYCFRREYPYEEASSGQREWQQAIDYIVANTDIDEVILSGGDPLTLSDKRLAKLCQRLAEIPHLKRLRIHSRLPIVLPERITTSLIEALKLANLPIVMVVHSNHAQELNQEVADAISLLRHHGISSLNQAVLLKDINDTVDEQRALSEALFEHGIMPYYLHLLDKTRGAAHFDVDENKARLLINTLRAQTSGYLVPRLVREIAGESSKTPVA